MCVAVIAVGMRVYEYCVREHEVHEHKHRKYRKYVAEALFHSILKNFAAKLDKIYKVVKCFV